MFRTTGALLIAGGGGGTNPHCAQFEWKQCSASSRHAVRGNVKYDVGRYWKMGGVGTMSSCFVTRCIQLEITYIYQLAKAKPKCEDN